MQKLIPSIDFIPLLLSSSSFLSIFPILCIHPFHHSFVSIRLFRLHFRSNTKRPTHRKSSVGSYFLHPHSFIHSPLSRPDPRAAGNYNALSSWLPTAISNGKSLLIFSVSLNPFLLPLHLFSQSSTIPCHNVNSLPSSPQWMRFSFHSFI